MLKEPLLQAQIRLLRRFQVEDLTGLKRSSIYALMQKGDFPYPVKITSKSVGWRYSDVRSWIDSRKQITPTQSMSKGA